MLYSIISFANKLRDSLTAIQESIEKIGGKIDTATAEYRIAQDTQRSTPITVSVLRSPEATADEVEARNTRIRTEQRDSRRLNVETWALWIGSVVALANIGLWIQTCNATRIAAISADAAKKSAAASAAQVDATKQSIEATVDNFRIDQRPYLGQSVKTTEAPQFAQNPNDPNSGQITWNWHFTNYGKTPANNVSFTQEIKLGDRPFVLSFGEKARDISPPIPPGQDIFDTVPSSPISKDELARLLKMNNGISIRIKISYRDATGTTYESGLCLTRTNAGSIPYCKTDNYIK